MRKYFQINFLALTLTALLVATTCACGVEAADAKKPDQSTTQPVESRQRGLVDRGVKPMVSGGGSALIQRTEKKLELIDNIDAFKTALRESDVSRVPEVDFEREVVVAAHAGFRPHLGYEVLIYPPKINDAGEHIIEVVFALTTDTCATGMADESILHPFAFAKFPRLTDGTSYKLVEKTVEEDCFTHDDYNGDAAAPVESPSPRCDAK